MGYISQTAYQKAFILIAPANYVCGGILFSRCPSVRLSVTFWILVHLSQRLIWWAYRTGRPPSSVVRCCPYTLNIFSSETTGPITVKFQMELLWDGGTKVCSNGPGHMTKMAAMPIFGKNLKKSSSLEPKGLWPWILVCIIRCSSTNRFAQMMVLGWPCPILWQGQIWSLDAFVLEKGKTMDFSETIVVYDLKLATNDRSDKKFLLTSKLCPLGLYTPCPWAIYMY